MATGLAESPPSDCSRARAVDHDCASNTHSRATIQVEREIRLGWIAIGTGERFRWQTLVTYSAVPGSTEKQRFTGSCLSDSQRPEPVSARQMTVPRGLRRSRSTSCLTFSTFDDGTGAEMHWLRLRFASCCALLSSPGSTYFRGKIPHGHQTSG